MKGQNQMRWTITSNKSILYPNVAVIEGCGVDDMERKVAFTLAQKGWNKDEVTIKNSAKIYKVIYSNGFIDLEFLIEGNDPQECQQKLQKIAHKCDFNLRNMKVVPY